MNDSKTNLYHFLRPIGLTDYFPHFQKAEVHDVETLLRLTEDDIKEVGLPVGPRRKLMDHIQGKNKSNNNTNTQTVNFGSGNIPVVSSTDLNNYETPPAVYIEDQTAPSTHDHKEEEEPRSDLEEVRENIRQLKAQGYDTSKYDQQMDQFVSHSSGRLEETVRPWEYFGFGMMLAPLLCISGFFHFMGHTVHYIFDNDERKLYLQKFRGMCCVCLGTMEEEYDYADITEVNVERVYNGRNQHGDRDFTAKVNMVVRGQSEPIQLTASKRTELVYARAQAERISDFTGIRYNTDEVTT
eukprot:gb/GECH01007702.1/.p1 GENE.gb/GECH01007702.1/~~gb/GECH01007702.1/.p1  ORF type:complete len:297 (+),score=45.37 gb/GECH01007702.1/:1-891(+)